MSKCNSNNFLVQTDKLMKFLSDVSAVVFVVWFDFNEFYLEINTGFFRQRCILIEFGLNLWVMCTYGTYFNVAVAAGYSRFGQFFARNTLFHPQFITLCPFHLQHLTNEMQVAARNVAKDTAVK